MYASLSTGGTSLALLGEKVFNITIMLLRGTMVTRAFTQRTASSSTSAN